MARKLTAKSVKADYDEAADVLYIYFDRSLPADDAEVTDAGVIVHTSDDLIVGLTVLSARKRIYPGEAAQ